MFTWAEWWEDVLWRDVITYIIYTYIYIYNLWRKIYKMYMIYAGHYYHSYTIGLVSYWATHAFSAFFRSFSLAFFHWLSLQCHWLSHTHFITIGHKILGLGLNIVGVIGWAAAFIAVDYWYYYYWYAEMPFMPHTYYYAAFSLYYFYLLLYYFQLFIITPHIIMNIILHTLLFSLMIFSL